MRQFLPHQILIAAWAILRIWTSRSTSSPAARVRTEQIAQCVSLMCQSLLRALGRCRAQAVRAQDAEVLAAQAACPCAVHGALGNMRSLLVHGVRDERNGHESLYIALDSGSLAMAGPEIVSFPWCPC